MADTKMNEVDATAAVPRDFEYLFDDTIPEPEGLDSASSSSTVVAVTPGMLVSDRKRKTPGSEFGTYSPEQMNDFKYYKWFNIDKDDGEHVTNGWQQEMLSQDERAKMEAKRARYTKTPDVLIVDVRAPLDNEQQLERMNSRAQHAFVALNGSAANCHNAIFYGMKETPTPYFKYTFTAGKGEQRGSQGKQVFFVRPATLKWKPVPAVKPVVMHLFNNEFPGMKNDLLRTIITQKLEFYNPPDGVITLPVIEGFLAQANQTQEILRLHRTPIIKRFFMHAKLEPMYKYYNVADLEALGVDAIETLCRFVLTPSLTNNPIALCFVDCARNLGLRCENFDRMWYLPELSYQHYMHICKQYKPLPRLPGLEPDVFPPPLELFAVKLYDMIKRHADTGGHKYIDDDQLSTMLDSHERSMMNDAFALLERYKAVVIEKAGVMRHVYLWDMHMYEEFILSSLETVFFRFAADMPENPTRPALKTDEEANKYPLLGEHSLCSEQQNMVECFPHTPILGVSGPAGAGKSLSLTKILAKVGAIDWKMMLEFVTYQANNAASAAETNTPFARTAHRLLASHANKCHDSPLYKKKNARQGSPDHDDDDGRGRGRGGRGRGSGSGGRGRGRDKGPQQTQLARFMTELEKPQEESEIEYVNCPLEEVKLLVIDEIGLFYEELFAPLLHILTTCGKLSQIVVCGDHRQLVQIQPGQLQKDLFYGFERWLLKYEHCHRFDDAVAVLFRHNAMMIDAMRPDLVVWVPGYFERTYTSTGRHISMYENKLLEGELEREFGRIGFGDTERCMGVTRTHEHKDVMLRAMERVHFGDVKPNVLRVGQKVFSKVTDYDADITARQVLVLEAIEDCALPPKMPLKWLEAKVFRFLKPVFVDALTTEAHKPRGHARRLKCRVVFSNKIVYLPYDGKFVNNVQRAGAVTTRSCQGTQGEHVFVLLLAYWDVADVKEGLYVVATRQKKRFTIFCTQESFYKWCTNPSPRRNSTLGSKLRALSDKFVAVFPFPAMPQRLVDLKEQEGQMYTPKLEMESGRYVAPALPYVC